MSDCQFTSHIVERPPVPKDHLHMLAPLHWYFGSVRVMLTGDMAPYQSSKLLQVRRSSTSEHLAGPVDARNPQYRVLFWQSNKPKLVKLLGIWYPSKAF